MFNMKCLTVKQPWASLIVNGYKKFEFRSWKTNYRGKILIHAGLSMENSERFNEYNLDYNRGMIVGEAEIVDCILVDKNFDQELREKNKLVYDHNHIGLYAWKLEKIVKYDNPIQAKGQLGLWEFKN